LSYILIKNPYYDNNSNVEEEIGLETVSFEELIKEMDEIRDAKN
jgi:hypothetical protein